MLFFRSNAAISGLAFPCTSSNHMCGLYVVETELEENSSHCAACHDFCRGGGRQLSAFPGDIPTSFLTDSSGMANDRLDCKNHRYDDH